jgi:predicted nuclease with TOPRIM domain
MGTNRKPVTTKHAPYFSQELEKRIPVGEREENVFQDGYKIGLKEGVKHSSSSPETIHQFKKMNEELTKIRIDQAETKKDVGYLRDKMDELFEEIRTGQERCLNCNTQFIKREIYTKDNEEHKSKHEKIDKYFFWMIVLGCLMIGAVFGQEAIKELIFKTI